MKFVDAFEGLPAVYVVKCNINGKFYIGETINMKNRMYSYRGKTASNLAIMRAIKKHGIDNFDIYVEYLPNFTKPLLIALEEALIIRFKSRAPFGYNVCGKGLDNTGVKRSEEAIQKLKISRRGAGNPMFGRKTSAFHKSTLSKRTKGVALSSETKAKISNSLKGHVISEETRKKISDTLKSKKLSKPLSISHIVHGQNENSS